jgi:hypothetical protein
MREKMRSLFFVHSPLAFSPRATLCSHKRARSNSHAQANCAHAKKSTLLP